MSTGSSEYTAGDYIRICDACGVMWKASKLRRKADGNMYCPDHKNFTPATELDAANAAAASRIQTLPVPDAAPRRETNIFAEVVGRIANFLAAVIPYRWASSRGDDAPYTTESTTMTLQTTTKSVVAIAEALRFYYNVYNDNRSSTVLKNEAYDQIVRLGNMLLDVQIGSSLILYGATEWNSVNTQWGAFAIDR